MKIIVAIDSFKGTALSQELNQVSQEAIVSVLPEAEVQDFTIADGGEGTLEALQSQLDGQIVNVGTIDLMGNQINAPYFIDGEMAIIETAKIIGLPLIYPNEETFEKTSSYGIGALVEDAISRGCKDIYLTLGGSGTSDGGFGFLESMGFDIETLSYNQNKIPEGVYLYALADVTNPYAGPNGYAMVFGKQKGGSYSQLEAENQKAQEFAMAVKQGVGVDLQGTPGTGAAGGLGGAVHLLGGQILPGFDTIARLIGLTEALPKADLVITGEGKLDSQSKLGKVPVSICQMAAKHHVPTIAVCGSVEDDAQLEDMFLATFAVQRRFLYLEQALENQVALSNVRETVKNVVKARYK